MTLTTSCFHITMYKSRKESLSLHTSVLKGGTSLFKVAKQTFLSVSYARFQSHAYALAAREARKVNF